MPFIFAHAALTAWAFIGTAALGTAGVDTGPLVAGLGVSSLVVGFAVKDVASNFMAGQSLRVLSCWHISLFSPCISLARRDHPSLHLRKDPTYTSPTNTGAVLMMTGRQLEKGMRVKVMVSGKPSEGIDGIFDHIDLRYMYLTDKANVCPGVITPCIPSIDDVT